MPRGWGDASADKEDQSVTRRSCERARRRSSSEGPQMGVSRPSARALSPDMIRNINSAGSSGNVCGDKARVDWRNHGSASMHDVHQHHQHLAPPPVTQFSNRLAHGSSSEESKKPLTQDSAATKIANLYRRRYRRKYLGRIVFAERLELEDKVNIGMRRLFLFGAIFAMIVYVNSLGIPTAERRAVKDLLDSALDLDAFREVRSIHDLRAVLPQISSRVKQFSASRGARFEVPEGLEILGERMEFTAPVVLSSLDQQRPQMKLDRPSWTMSVWVESLSQENATAGSRFRSIIRRPDSHNRLLNCWGWYHPAQFRHGASDFHTLEPENDVWEEITTAIPAPGAAMPARLSHEMVIVSHNVMKFYRDGELVGRALQLTRDITDCWNPDKVELGSAGLALTAVKFYPRALNDGEVREVYKEGEPLTELATGTELPRLSASLLHQVRGHIDASAEEIVSTVSDKSDDHFMLSSVMDIEGIRAENYDDETIAVMFPPDGAPPPVLPLGIFGEMHLAPHEKKLWEDGGFRTGGYEVNSWMTDTNISARYWSIFEDPVFTDGYPWYYLPDFPEDSDGLCISFWYRADRLSQGHGPLVEIWKEYPVTDLPIYIYLEQQLDWAYITAYVGGHTPDYREINSWRYLTYFEEVSGRTRENFLLTAFVQEPEPVVWRHLAYQYNVSSRSISFYLDGRFVWDSRMTTERMSTPYQFKRTMSVRELFSNATLLQAKISGDVDSHPEDTIPGKMAQLRIYDRLLQPEEILVVQNSARWPGGEVVKRCADYASTNDFYDSKGKDVKGRTCAWYANANLHHQYVCSSVEAKRMCPVTCKGKRICHDGSLDPNFHPRPPRRKFRVFDRIMWIKPRNGVGSVICPSTTAAAQQDQIMARCRAIKGSHGAGWRGPPEAVHNFTDMIDRTWHRLDPVNLWDCDDVEPRIDAEQCAWDDSWLSDFKTDYDELESWSLSFWIRPKAGSFKMPTNFWFAIALFSELSPPLVLNHWNERDPQLEPWMDTRTVTSDPSRMNGFTTFRAAIWPTTLIDYTGSWTMLYAQLQRKPDGTFQFCATMNAMPTACSTTPGKAVFSPEKLLEAIEFTTEMLVSPLEITTEVLTPAEIQQKYYREWRRMETVRGPAYPEFERSAHVRSERVLQPFDERVALVAPPLVFQERSEPEACVSPVTIPFFQAQKLLMLAAHCRESSCPLLEGDPDATDMIATCHGTSGQNTHFGLEPSNFGARAGYTDFLYTIADNSVLVRDGKALSALNFVDANTMNFLIIALFHVPNSALTTALELSGDVSGNAIEPDVKFRHYGYLKKEERGTVVSMYVALFALIVVTLIVNGIELYHLWRDAKKVGIQISRAALAEICYDFFQCAIVLVYAGVTFHTSIRSEEVAVRIVSNVATVPFYESDKAFSEKTQEFFSAAEEFNQRLAWDSNVDSLAFAIMVLMLVRIIAATAVHPRTGVLTGTIWKTLNDLWHFGILFMIVFLCFGLAANLFFGERDDFADTQTALQTQFNMLLGELPEDYQTDPRIIVYVCLSSVVMFLLMLNFLLAIIVDGYMQVRTDIETSEAENEFVTDVGLSFYADVLSIRNRWPHKREVAHALRQRIRSERVCARHLIIQGFPTSAIRDMIDWYYTLDGLSTDPPIWEKKPSRYDLALGGVPLTPNGADSWRGLQLEPAPMPPTDASVSEKLESIGQRLRQLEGMAQDVSELKAAVIMLVEEHKGDGSFFSMLTKASSRAQLTLAGSNGDDGHKSARDKQPRHSKHRRHRDKKDKLDESPKSDSQGFFSFAPRKTDSKRNSDPPPAVGFGWSQDVRARIVESIANFTGAGNAPAPTSAPVPTVDASPLPSASTSIGNGAKGGEAGPDGARVCGVV